LAVDVVHADWDAHGRRAGPIRNAEVVARSDRLVAFWNGKSRGVNGGDISGHVAAQNQASVEVRSGVARALTK